MLVDLNQVLEIIDNEPKFPGEMPEEIETQIRKVFGKNIDINKVTEFIQLICQVTKKIIRYNILEALTIKEEKICGHS